jgi:major membrane immunogen (membrane-anchored lipoprotein)
MKTVINMIMLPLSLLAACSNPQKQVKDFVPGTYVSHAQSAYSIADDTLVIKADPLTEEHYQVTRKTGFRRLPNGEPQYKSKNFSGTYDEQRGTLQLTENGLVILFQPAGHQLEIANSKYRKL